MKLNKIIAPYVDEMIALSVMPSVASPETVYCPANKPLQKLIFSVFEDFVLPSSRIDGLESLLLLHQKVLNGHSGLLMLEHFSNMDLPALAMILRRLGYDDVVDSFLAIAGIKLRLESPIIRSLVETIAQVAIYPLGTLEKLSQQEQDQEVELARKINFSSMRALEKYKKQGSLVVLFPSGTRYRPGKEETKRIRREVTSYVKLFDYVVLGAINGNVLPVGSDNLEEDILQAGPMLYTLGSLEESKKFIQRATEQFPNEDQRQSWADAITQEFERLHAEGLTVYESLV